MSWWPDARGKSVSEIMAGTFTELDALLTMSREYGFENWGCVEALGALKPDAAFEGALDDMLAGDVEALKARLEANSSLVAACSNYGHGATLLHYLGANGVETHRQKTPLNAPDLARLLIAHGADRSAMANMYGGGQTPYALASTSAHPHNAGIAEELNAVLRP